MTQHVDCLVLGGGPAGSTAAALVAEGGYRTLLVERDRMPRFHIGESLMPETYWTFKRLGILDQMKASNFVKKLSVQFVSHSGRESQPFFFDEHDPRECSQTWQVLRSDFDQMLLDTAAEKGAECREGTRVVDVLFDGDRAVGATIQTDNGPLEEITADVVVDASGQSALVARKLGLLRPNPELRKASIWGYYEGAKRDAGKNGGATVIIQSGNRKAWFWCIPLADDITSIGVVADSDYLLRDRGTPEQVFEEELTHCPAVLERMVAARLASKFRVAREFSYSTSQSAGDGWVLVGDSWGFIDPIYSSGVYFGLKSGEMAADAIVEGLSVGDTSAKQLGRWLDDFTGGVKWISKLVDAYYTDGFSFGQFMKAHPEHRGNLTDLLIGRIFHKEAGAIFADMDPWLTRASAVSDV
jgi:flavin-dependent dehydrogenase